MSEWRRWQVIVKAIFTSSGPATHSICTTRCWIHEHRPSSMSLRFPMVVDIAHGIPMLQLIQKIASTSLGQIKEASMKSYTHYSTLVWMIRMAPLPMTARFRLSKTLKSFAANRIVIGLQSQSTVRTTYTSSGRTHMTDTTSTSSSHKFTTNS